MSEQGHTSTDVSVSQNAESRGRMLLVNPRVLNWSSFAFAILQSACTAVIAISGLRIAIGLSALAAAAGIHAPARGFHQDAIRIPMMVLAFLGALANLLVVWKIRNLRKKPSSRWRQK